MTLYPYQLDAVKRMHNGCILAGGVGSGKSLTSLAYYFRVCGGICGDPNRPYTDMTNPIDLYIITTAAKRDKKEWEKEISRITKFNAGQKIVIDSWNNVLKYREIKSAFFIFDEAKQTGGGKWSKTFIYIAKNNNWILLSATPGDKWIDWAPVFIANGYYKNITEFRENHVHYVPHVTFPMISGYFNESRLYRLKRLVLVDMDYHHEINIHKENVICDNYDVFMYKEMVRSRQNPYDNYEPFKNASSLCYALRKCVNTAPSRAKECINIVKKHGSALIFYSYDYELLDLEREFLLAGIETGEMNGHRHTDIPEGKLLWAYFVNYNAGAEGWECTKTNCTIFYSLNYSYRIMEQASGRINRNNTPYMDLYYYYLKSHAPIDIAISRAIGRKRKFNETIFAGKLE